MNTKLLNNIAESLKISPVALSIYVSLMEHGEQSTEYLYKMSDKNSEEIHNAISELSKKHLIGRKKEKKDMLFARTILELESQSEMQIKHAKDLKERAQDLKNFLLPGLKYSEEKEFFQFEGWDEIRQTYIELLEKAQKSKSFFIALENNMVNSYLGDDFVEKFIKLRIQYKVKAYVICPNNAEDKKYKKHYENKYTEIKLIDNLTVDGNMNIVGNTIMWFDPNTLEGDCQQKTSKANTLKSSFWHMWKN